MTHIYKQNDYVEIEFDYLGLIYIFKIDGLKSFNYEWYEEDNYIDYINIFYDEDKNMYTFFAEEDYIDLQSTSISIKYLDIENTSYKYASVKYKEDSERTFYYIADTDEYKIGDYVEVPVRDTNKIAIIDNLENFSYLNMPFPIKYTKHIIRKASKYEFEQQGEIKD